MLNESLIGAGGISLRRDVGRRKQTITLGSKLSANTKRLPTPYLLGSHLGDYVEQHSVPGEACPVLRGCCPERCWSWWEMVLQTSACLGN